MTFLLLTVWFLLIEHELFLQGNFIHRHIGFVYRISSFFSVLLEFKPIIEFKPN